MRVVICLLTVGALLTAAPLPAQTSLGFADPTDLDALLAYRLPDWGYRTWDGSLNLNGNGRTGDRIRNYNDLALGTDVTFYGESEQATWQAGGHASGGFSHQHLGDVNADLSQRVVDGATALDARLDRYLGNSNVFVSVAGNGRALYHEARQYQADQDESAYVRTYDYGIRPGLGIGRIRDVTPLIRARRLSERLAALGRTPLTGAQVVAIAQVLAQDYGYRNVYDRPDRHFWRDVLQPLLDPDHPLSVYELEYLEEVLLESTGSRRQGQMFRVWVDRTESQWRSDPQTINTTREVGATVTWARNISLTQQFVVSGSVSYAKRRSTYDNQDVHDEVRREVGRATLQAAYLNNLNDRNRLDVILRAAGSYSEITEARVERGFSTDLVVTDSFYIEDRLVLRPRVAMAYDTASNNGGLPVDPHVSWQYSLSLDYHFDRLLY